MSVELTNKSDEHRYNDSSNRSLGKALQYTSEHQLDVDQRSNETPSLTETSAYDTSLKPPAKQNTRSTGVRHKVIVPLWICIDEIIRTANTYLLTFSGMHTLWYVSKELRSCLGSLSTHSWTQCAHLPILWSVFFAIESTDKTCHDNAQKIQFQHWTGK